jgi:hypothetical protein
MAEALTLDRVRNAGWHDALLGCINGHLTDPSNAGVRDKIMEAIERGGLVSKGVMAVVGTYQRQTITTPGLYKDLVAMNDAIAQGKAPPTNGAPAVPPVEVPEPVMAVTEHIERPEPTPEAHPVPEALPTAESVATSPPIMAGPAPTVLFMNPPPAEVHVEPTPSEAEHSAPVGGKPPGNLFRRKSSAFYFLEVMRDGGPRTREDAVAVALKRWPASEIGENASILHKMNWSMFLRMVRDGKADAHGWTYGLEKVDGTRVKLLVRPPAASALPASIPNVQTMPRPADPLPEPPADAMPAWAEPPVVTPTAPESAPAPQVVAAVTTFQMVQPGDIPEEVVRVPAGLMEDLALLRTYRAAAQESKRIEDRLAALKEEMASLQEDLDTARDTVEKVGEKLLGKLEG